MFVWFFVVVYFIKFLFVFYHSALYHCLLQVWWEFLIFEIPNVDLAAVIKISDNSVTISSTWGVYFTDMFFTTLN
jgi:hypothetical protein